MALISKGIQLWAKANDGTGASINSDHPYDPTNGIELFGLQEIGELAGVGAGTSRDKIEVTTLADDKHMYVDGIQAESDNSAISFKFLFDADLFKWFKDMSLLETGYRGDGDTNKLPTYSVKVPVGEAYHTFSFKGYISDLKMDSAGVNAALTMSMSLTPIEAISFTKAVVA